VDPTGHFDPVYFEIAIGQQKDIVLRAKAE